MFRTRRRFERIFLLAAFLYLSFFGIGPALSASAGASTPVEAANPDASVYRIQSGDTLKITIYDDEELSKGEERPVRGDGTISVPYVNVEVKVVGFSIKECTEAIRKRLVEEKMYINPNLDVSILKYAKRNVYVIGLVEQPGEVAFEDGKAMTIDAAIAKAGGFVKDKRPARNKVKLIREGKQGLKETKYIRVDDIRSGKAKQVYLKHGDIIEVTESFL